MGAAWGSALRVPGGEFWWLLQDAINEKNFGEAAHRELLELGAQSRAAWCDVHHQLTALMALARALRPADAEVKTEPVDLVARLSLGGGWMPLG